MSIPLNEVVESNLARLPQVNSLSFDIHSWGGKGVREVVSREGTRWEEIDIWGGQHWIKCQIRDRGQLYGTSIAYDTILLPS